MECPINNLPPLPDGWHYECHSFDSDVVHVTWPGRGVVSIHFKRRTIGLGWCIPSPARRDATLPSGKGWKDKLVLDAVKLLQATE